MITISTLDNVPDTHPVTNHFFCFELYDRHELTLETSLVHYQPSYFSIKTKNH